MAIVAVSAGACYEAPPPASVICGSLDSAQFQPVSNLLEKRCGTLDCHGTRYRPLRFYGFRGQRLYTLLEFDDVGEAQRNGTFTGGKPTTDEEREENWRSLCGLEPEKMSQVQAGTLTPLDLMILKKPLLIERHKGAKLFLDEGQAGARCLISWLEGETNQAECAEALRVP